MNIIVFNVAAESGGALSILYEFYEKFKKDDKNNYILVLSKPLLRGEKNVQVLRFPWIKKSWLHRLYFDYFVAPRLILKYKAKKSISLQNIMVPNTRIHQTIYVHNSLPFSDYRFSFFENRMLWIHQNILSRKVYKSIRKSDKVIVQTNWMRDACLNKVDIDESKIEILRPEIKTKVEKYYTDTSASRRTFFYPASGVPFKNHMIIIEACLRLKSEVDSDYCVIFTLLGDENKYVKGLYKLVSKLNLPIKFVGSLEKEAVFELYSKSTLLFSSYIETVGLPLLEAKMHRAPVLASDCPFSREVLGSYGQASFFDPFDAGRLSVLMQGSIAGTSE